MIFLSLQFPVYKSDRCFVSKYFVVVSFYFETQLHCLSLPISAGGRSRVERRRSLRHRCHRYILTCFLALYLVFVFVYLCGIVAIATSSLASQCSLSRICICICISLQHPSCILLLLFRPCFVFGLCIYDWEFLRVSRILNLFQTYTSPLLFISNLLLKYCSKMDRLFLLNTMCVLSRSMAYRWEPFYLVLILYSN